MFIVIYGVMVVTLNPNRISPITRVLGVIALLFLDGCRPPELSHQAIVVRFDHTQLAIPQKYLLPPLPSSKGIDKKASVLLTIPLQDLGYPIEKKIGFRYELIFLITPLSIHHSPKLPPSGLEAWTGSGLYKDRFVEFDEVTQLYRVYYDAEA